MKAVFGVGEGIEEQSVNTSPNRMTWSPPVAVKAMKPSPSIVAPSLRMSRPG